MALGSPRRVAAVALLLAGAGAVTGCAAPVAKAPTAAAVLIRHETPVPHRASSVPVVPRPVVVWPLTGLPARGDVRRPALSVKVDNAPAARPQSGLNAADLVVEEPVEGGLSRFFAVFQSHDATVGPIRSARPVDGALLRALHGGVFAYSGAAEGEIAPARAYGLARLVSNDADPAPFSRWGSYRAPDNLFARTRDLRAAGGDRGSPPPGLFAYAPELRGLPPASALHVTLGSDASADWSYAGGGYVRSEQGTPHLLADGSQIEAANVIVMTVAVAHSGITDANHVEDPFVLAYGSGELVTLSHGAVQRGTWSRPSVAAPYRFTVNGGGVLALTPGRTWIELVPQPGGAIPAGTYRYS